MYILPLSAQVSSAELSGTVFDATGAAVSAAKVTATNSGTNVSHDASSDASGNYVIRLLSPGDYVVTVEAAGFKKLVQRGLNLQVNQQAQLNLVLEVGAVSEEISVTAQAPQLQSEASSLGTVVSEKLVNQLPLNGRNFIQLAVLSPGVTGVGFGASGTIMSGTRPDDRRPGTEIFSNGNREGSNNFLFDGVDDNERLTLSIVLRPAVEAVREFKIQTNLYSAASGATPAPWSTWSPNQVRTGYMGVCLNFCETPRSTPAISSAPRIRLSRLSASISSGEASVVLLSCRNCTVARTRPSSSWTMKVTAGTPRSCSWGMCPQP